MSPPIFQIIKLLFDPDVSKKLILQMALKQIKMIGYAKVLAALLGAAMVGVSSFIKIPQIQKIVNPKLLSQRVSVANGLSLQSLTLETFNQLVHVVFNKQNNVPFINYGESFFLGIQNAILILLVSFYRNKQVAEIERLPTAQKLAAAVETVGKPAAIMAAVAIFINKIAPPGLVDALEVLNIPISVLAKVPQIQNNSRLKSTAHLSDVTIRANLLGSVIRVYTTLTSLSGKKQRGKDLRSDYVLLAGYLSSLALNGTLVYQSVIYKDNKPKDAAAGGDAKTQ
ncbi:hypothetical protein DIURU_001343 [Diutina rugosa]|uniref:Solute carrier family 66 member 3 n=1 Tax=Diutina rugosa TaxID=5481 RepID=A0A642UUR3_DIURU|nr:uncharacterized protein DIURU_001343 [Diutina rugosa]KAA8905807.1 hypothetical protein DIURU_001343 [Diutina rugosa]